MRTLAVLAASGVLGLTAWGCGGSTPPNGGLQQTPSQGQAAAGSGEGKIVGFAFVDSSVTAQGAKAQLPPNTKIFPPGSTITGTDGCPTNRYNTDGNPVVVIDYSGRPTAASVTVTRTLSDGRPFTNAPYYLDLDPGRRLQNLGPIFDNGSYGVEFDYSYNLGAQKTVKASFTLARNCR